MYIRTYIHIYIYTYIHREEGGNPDYLYYLPTGPHPQGGGGNPEPGTYIYISKRIMLPDWYHVLRHKVRK